MIECDALFYETGAKDMFRTRIMLYILFFCKSFKIHDLSLNNEDHNYERMLLGYVFFKDEFFKRMCKVKCNLNSKHL